ncbi:DUF1694 domain-containing protein [Streptococcus sp. S784/96/1]|uniref:DUF1694 domain-containing protein n=1 Tax=Streptococcus sp. S784/96/1 TaxID=2653499 RepID=UPI00138A4D94|nr:DUF1694 domain-containing protein [Streptococcus sp. S784/96/1]
MDSLENRILSHSSNEHRFDPNQQKEFLGTFRERVVLAIKTTDLSPELFKNLPYFLVDFNQNWQPLVAKISSEINISSQMSLMKLAKQHNLPSTIVQEKEATSPYAFIVHSDHAINLEQIEPVLATSSSDNASPKHKKLSFFGKLWKKR